MEFTRGNFHGLVVPLWDWTGSAGQRPVNCPNLSHLISRPPCPSPILSHPIWRPPCPCPTCHTYSNLYQPVAFAKFRFFLRAKHVFFSEVVIAHRFSFRMYPEKCTELDLSLFYIVVLGTYSKFAWENDFLAPVVCFPQPCSSAGRRFATSRSRLQNYRRIFRFHNQNFDEMRCKLDSTENPRSFEKYPTPP